jgi:hypothetical protein
MPDFIMAFRRSVSSRLFGTQTNYRAYAEYQYRPY